MKETENINIPTAETILEFGKKHAPEDLSQLEVNQWAFLNYTLGCDPFETRTFINTRYEYRYATKKGFIPLPADMENEFFTVVRKVTGHNPSNLESAFETFQKLNHQLSSTSLNEPLGEQENHTLLDLIIHPSIETTEKNAIDENLKDQFDEILAALPERYRLVLEMRVGRNGHAPSTLAAIGKKLGITREGARQIEQKALKKAKIMALENGLSEFLE